MIISFGLKPKKIKQSKRLKAMLHILNTPHGVSEKSINKAASCMSGRNFPTDLERTYNIQTIKPRTRRTAPDGSLYSIYQLMDIDQVRKLIELIKHYCLVHRLPPVDQTLIDRAVLKFEYYLKNKTAKK